MLNIVKNCPEYTSSAQRVWNIESVCSCIEDNLKLSDIKAEDNLVECRQTELDERIVAFKYTAYDRIVIAIHSTEGTLKETLASSTPKAVRLTKIGTLIEEEYCQLCALMLGCVNQCVTTCRVYVVR